LDRLHPPNVLLQDGNAFGTSTASDVQQMGNNVFRNAAPFLRVRRGEVAALQNEEEFDALDDARIHPEDEALLQVMRHLGWQDGPANSRPCLLLQLPPVYVILFMSIYTAD